MVILVIFSPKEHKDSQKKIINKNKCSPKIKNFLIQF